MSPLELLKTVAEKMAQLVARSSPAPTEPCPIQSRNKEGGEVKFYNC